MRKFLALLLLLILAGLGYIAYAHISGGAVPTFGLPIGGEKARVRQTALRFFEDIKFKNIDAMQNLVKIGTPKEEIDAFMHQSLAQDPANIDLQSVKIDSVEIDSTKQRARVRLNLGGQDLKENKALAISKVIFLYLDDQNNWLVDITNLSP